MKRRVYQTGCELRGRDLEQEIEGELAEVRKVEAMTDEEAFEYCGDDKDKTLQLIHENIHFLEDCQERITFVEYDDDYEYWDEYNYETDEHGWGYWCPCLKSKSA